YHRLLHSFPTRRSSDLKAKPRSPTTDLVPPSSGSFDKSCNDCQNWSIVFDKPLSDGSFNKLSNLSKPSCFVFQYSCRLVSERYCVSKKWLRIRYTIPASTPVPNCPGIFGITREGTGKGFVALNSTRCLE